MSMSGRDGERVVKDAIQRFNQALDMLELAFDRRQVAGGTVNDLQMEIQSLSRDRSLLADEIDSLRERNIQLEQLRNDMIACVDRAIETVEDVMETVAPDSVE